MPPVQCTMSSSRGVIFRRPRVHDDVDRGNPFAGFKAIVELAAKVLRTVWGVWRSGIPYDPRRAGGLTRQAR